MAFAPALTRRALFGAVVAATALPGALFAQEAAPREVVEMVLGAEDAPVTMIEYASFTCPHCATFHQSVMPQIQENFVETGRVKVIYREVYFDRPGLWASMIARCAGPDRYFGVVDLLYQSQASWSRATDAPAVMEQLSAIGRQAGLTDAAMEECMQDRDFAQALVTWFQDNAIEHAIDSTPSFIIDGEKVGNLPYPEMERRLNAALQN